MANDSPEKYINVHDVERQKRISRQNKKLGFIILYVCVLLLVIVGEVVLFKIKPNITIWDLVTDVLGNLMGVLAAFVVFDIAHEWISKDTYAAEVSEQILDTLMYHPETMELYENTHKKVFVNSVIGSIVNDLDVAGMINNHLNSYLITKEDFEKRKDELTEKDCRIRTTFLYRMVLETERTVAFSTLNDFHENDDPYFYVQEEINYTVKYLSPKGNNTDTKQVKMGLIYDNAYLDRFLRGNRKEQNNGLMKNCIFRESLDITDADKMLFRKQYDNGELYETVKRMFRPHMTIDRHRGKLVKVDVGSWDGNDFGLFFVFEIDHNTELMEHDIEIIFHMPKKWNTILEIVLIEPTKDPKISLSYNEDAMDVEMYSFLNKGESSSYENTLEEENGVFSISLSNEWVFPISGTVFFIKRNLKKIIGEDNDIRLEEASNGIKIEGDS